MASKDLHIYKYMSVCNNIFLYFAELYKNFLVTDTAFVINAIEEFQQFIS